MKGMLSHVIRILLAHLAMFSKELYVVTPIFGTPPEDSPAKERVRAQESG